jgi:hypothetical protein
LQRVIAPSRLGEPSVRRAIALEEAAAHAAGLVGDSSGTEVAYPEGPRVVQPWS